MADLIVALYMAGQLTNADLDAMERDNPDLARRLAFAIHKRDTADLSRVALSDLEKQPRR